MLKFYHLILAGLIAVPVFASSQRDRLLSVAERLENIGCYSDSCSYEILLASLAEPVSYKVCLETAPASANDTLAPCKYIISWSLPSPNGISEGFSSYFDGSHYRFRDVRLQEYHAEWDSTPFAPSGDVSKGVQNQVQFADLLPQFIGLRLKEMADNPSQFYTVTSDTLVSGRKSTVVKGVQRMNGFDGAEYNYVFDNETLCPVLIQLENNPGQIGEQSISINYSNAVLTPECNIDYETLNSQKAYAFENYRESSFSLEKLPGRPMPRIAAPTTTGERYLHNSGDPFAAPTIFVFLDASVGSTPDVISDVRKAVEYLPMQADIVWAFINHRIEDIDEVLISPLPGEHILMNARSAAADCGIGDFTPVLIFANKNGDVTDYVKGLNNNMTSIVMQKVSLSN